MENFVINLDENRKEEFLRLLAENGFGEVTLKEDETNMTLMTDLYELTMSQVNFDSNEQNDIAYFDGFFRREPLDAGYGLIGGTDSMIEYIQNLHFTDSDIATPIFLISYRLHTLHEIFSYKPLGTSD